MECLHIVEKGLTLQKKMKIFFHGKIVDFLKVKGKKILWQIKFKSTIRHHMVILEMDFERIFDEASTPLCCACKIKLLNKEVAFWFSQ